MLHKLQSTITLSQNHHNVLLKKIIFQQIYLKHTIAPHFPKLLQKKLQNMDHK